MGKTIVQSAFRRDLEYIVSQLDDGSETAECEDNNLVKATKYKLRFKLRFPGNKLEEFLNTPVSEIGLNLRTERGCESLGIRTVNDAIFTWKTLTVVNGKALGFKEGTGLGRISVRDLKTRVIELYYEDLTDEQRVRFWKDALKGEC